MRIDKTLSVGQIINIQAYKHNGKLYRQWNGARVIEVSPEQVVLFMYKTKVKESKKQKWTIREPMLWWFPLDELFNTTAIIRKSGTYFYTNIASPPIFWRQYNEIYRLWFGYQILSWHAC